MNRPDTSRPDPCERITLRVVLLADDGGPSFRIAVPMLPAGAWLPRELAWPEGPEASDGTVTISLPRGLAEARGLIHPGKDRVSHHGEGYAVNPT